MLDEDTLTQSQMQLRWLESDEYEEIFRAQMFEEMEKQALAYHIAKYGITNNQAGEELEPFARGGDRLYDDEMYDDSGDFYEEDEMFGGYEETTISRCCCR
jgi:hypothetical protein